jgi:hypothetical protein
MGIKMNSSSRINKMGQITIFIIIAILIVAGVILGVYFMGRYSTQEPTAQNPQAYIDKCIRDSITPSVEKIIKNGGKIDPNLFILYKSERYNYLCYQKNYYDSCINYYPQLKQIIESEIKKDSEAKVATCFDSLKKELEKEQFSVSKGEMSFSVELVSGKVIAHVETKIEISKGETAQSFSNWGTQIISPVYDLAMIAREIVNQESQFCNFEYNGFMLLYPAYKIKRISYNNSRIYEVIDRVSGKDFRFAVRGCVVPAGF